ncbi:YciI family protein [Actinokineospora inagensis]|uniref:YciI family protein n=1 Tax=Actinokineospora inagensis TaxID=103730 RepID=UPI00041F769E|nr:YciI family protein [Actinokineospora inagensis]
MAQYLLNIQQPDGEPPAPEFLGPIMARVTELDDDLRAAGAWVFNAGLLPPHTATVVRAKDDEVLLTDGPYTEGREHVGGFWVIEAPDLDAALAWGRRAAVATTLPIEVRPCVSRG